MQTVIGAFDDYDQAQRAVEQLTRAGIPRDDVHVERQEADTGRTMQQEQGSSSSGGGFFARLFGMDDQATASHASTYDEAVRRGSAVVLVDTQNDEQADRACTLLHEAGAYDVNERAQQWRAGGWNPSGQREGAAEKEGVLDVVQEELQVGKRRMERGGVRVVQRVSEQPVREVVRLREEHATVQRTPVNRAATPGDLESFKEGTLEVRESVEEPVVAKTARVVEEVRVGKEVREREEVIEDSVRRKDVDVQRTGGERAYAAEETRNPKKDKPI